jgi:NhaA family Na+:H+ antiporter
LKVFLAALAIIDDLGAVIVIAIFYTSDLNLWALCGAGFVPLALVAINRLRINSLVPYLVLGAVLSLRIFLSGVHATIAGVLLALTIPIKRMPGTPEASKADSPLHRLEHMLHRPVSFFVVPLFGFANTGLSLAGITAASFAEPVTFGIGLGLFAGKMVGVFGSVWLMVKTGVADLPASASWGQTFGVAMLCGIGFTMALFVTVLASDDAVIRDQAKLGILAGSLLAGLAGYFVLSVCDRRKILVNPVLDESA